MCTGRLQYFGSMDKQCIVVYYSTTLNGDTIHIYIGFAKLCYMANFDICMISMNIYIFEFGICCNWFLHKFQIVRNEILTPHNCKEEEHLKRVSLT